MSKDLKKDWLPKLQERYAWRRREGKSRMLDELCEVRRGGKQTKIEWVFGRAFRFFPVEPDPELGWQSNFWDVAANKILAFAGRSEIRD
jgi:hypothetical protein